MEPLVSRSIRTDFGMKDIGVYHMDIRALDQPVDLLVLSAFRDSYGAVPGTVIGAIRQQYGIDVLQLSKAPEIDVRNCGGVWLSR